AFRAPGHPQNCVLTEFAVDDLAAKLGLDPLVVRRKNLPPNDPKVKAANPLAWAGRRHDIYTEQLDLVVKLSGWKEKWHPPGAGPGRAASRAGRPRRAVQEGGPEGRGRPERPDHRAGQGGRWEEQKGVGVEGVLRPARHGRGEGQGRVEPGHLERAGQREHL